MGDRLVRAGDRLVEAAAVAVALAMLSVVVLGVVFRGLGSPLVWSDELAQYLLVWLGFLGWLIATRRRSHIRITVLLDRLPDLPRRALEIVLQLAIVLFACVLMWQSRGLIARNIDIEAVTLPFPSALLYVLLPVLAAALMLQALGEIAAVLRGSDPHRPGEGGQAL